MQDNILLQTDSYKQTHWRMYPPGTTEIESYLEARRGGECSHTVFFGLQYILKRYLTGTRVTAARIQQAQTFCQAHFGQEVWPGIGWQHILDRHAGRLPVEICAVREGQRVPTGHVLLTIRNTDPACYWLTNHLETLLVQVWYPLTIASLGRVQYDTLQAAAERSGDPTRVPFQLHDFGYRGSTSEESAALGGAAHLLHFRGTDTLAACRLVQQYYGATMPGHSVPAAEHSTITTWGPQGEEDAFAHILSAYPEGIVSVVSDSWDIRRACRALWGSALRDQVQARAGTVVVRPDSGDPIPTLLDCLELLGEAFGTTRNAKGYRLLPDCIRLIQGDGITRRSLPVILDALLEAHWSTDNVVFGSGGGLLQECTRDTLRVAMKCCHAVVDGTAREVSKLPVTDPAKHSRRGRLALVQDARTGAFGTVNADQLQDTDRNLLEPVFRDGQLLRELTWAQVLDQVAAA